ncbi:MAG: hypothetical protein IPJ78_12570 [Gemmatimonadetes bacterium]|nr:hypothetical protein [Gemmatimonadota bacterium]
MARSSIVSLIAKLEPQSPTSSCKACDAMSPVMIVSQRAAAVLKAASCDAVGTEAKRRLMSKPALEALPLAE